MYDNYMNTEELAKFIGVKRHTVEKWRKKGWLMPDAIGHGKNGRGGVYYYSKEHVLQLASVYRKKNCNQTATYTPQKGCRKGTKNDNCKRTLPPNKGKQRVNELVHFLNQLYGKIPESNFAYLWTKQDKETYPFAIPAQISLMAQKAIELADSGVDVYHSVNPVGEKPTGGKRGDEKSVSYQVACVVDIDVRSDAHKGDANNFPANFNEAKSFLPFTPSLIINSGYGLHAYYIFDTPIKITDLNREELKKRNSRLIELVRLRAGQFKKSVDSVGDLPRILRTPATYNYKLGNENAPLCHIVEVNDIRYTPADFDAKLDALRPEKMPSNQSARKILNFDDSDFNLYRARRMLDFITPSNLTYDDWLAVGIALKNIGCACGDWEQWSRSDDRFKDGECEHKWQGFSRDGNGFGTLYYFAQQGGYDAREVFQEFFTAHPELKKNLQAAQIDLLKNELREVTEARALFAKEKNAALERLRNVETFDTDTVFAEKILQAAAQAYLFDKQTFTNFKRDIINFGNKHKDKKISVNDWLADVRDKAALIKSRQAALITSQNEIQAKINSLSFAADCNLPVDVVIPQGYSVTKNGIDKVAGENLITVCRRPVIITGKTFSVDDKINYLSLAYMTTAGKWKILTPTEKAILANKNKIVDLANADLPVTTSNANLLVDYLDAFNAQNETAIALTYSVNRCGWYSLGGKDYFVDPRRDCLINLDDDDNKEIAVKVDESKSEFANHLKQVGDLEKWKQNAYLPAKKSPVARLVVAASVAAPLLYVLGERNFMLYICAPTRAGKTTVLLLAASIIGDERIIRSFDATKNGLAGAAADVNDYPFLIDEKQVADNFIKEQLQLIVYALVNGIGRTKLNKNSTLRKLQDWRTLPIAAGETELLPDNVTGGANTRLLSINVAKEILSADTCKKIRDTIKGNYGIVFPLVIDKILEVGKEKLCAIYEEMVATFTERFPDILPEYRRYMAVLTLADTFLNSVLFGNTAKAPDGTTIKASDDAILNAVKIFPLIPTIGDIADAPRAKDFLLGKINQNQNHFIGGNIEDNKIQGIWGSLNEGDGYIYITVAALKDLCHKHERDYCKLVSDLIAAGCFIPADTTEKGRKKTRDTVQKKIGNTNTRCYRIPRTVLEEQD